MWNLGNPAKTANIFQIRESFETLETGIEPLAEIVMCCGFFVIYFVEELVYMCCVRDELSDSREAIVKG